MNSNSIFECDLSLSLFPRLFSTSTPRASSIVNGAHVAPFTRPFVGMLTQSGSLICGVTLIHRDWALTAAHCITEGVERSKYKVEFHRSDISKVISAERR
eukprot:976484_1